MRVTTRNARFQQWQALLTNRTKRQRDGEFVVQGVRPVTAAVAAGWPVRTLLYNAEAALSGWATRLLDEVAAPRVALSAELLGELGDRADAAPELLAVLAIPPDDLSRIGTGPGLLAVVFDRPTSPGNLGTLIRSADAFGASGVVVTGHAADVYDPKAVRASTGSLFGLPVVRAPGPRPVLDWLSTVDHQLIGTDERGEVELAGVDLTRPTVVLVGNETAGLSTAWRDACDRLARIPMSGSASSLNAATAASIVLYEAARQRAS